jgi:hypothetical protein
LGIHFTFDSTGRVLFAAETRTAAVNERLKAQDAKIDIVRAYREGWRREIQNATALAKHKDTSRSATPFEAVSASIQQRGERHVGRMANIVEKTLPHVEAMQPGAILDRVDDVDTLDKIGRRTFKLDDNLSAGGIDISILSIGGNVDLADGRNKDLPAHRK